MALTYKELLGFNFIKVGNFYINDIPLPVKYNGKNDQVLVSLNFVNESFRKSDESAYLIYVEDELVYVGEFSYNLEDRWLRKGNYVWHNKDEEIKKELDNHREVSLWLIVNPFEILHNSNKINISKSIEQEILRQKYPEWNKRGQLKKHTEWRSNNCRPVSDIIDEIGE